MTLPDGVTSVGDLRFTLTTDFYDYVFERKNGAPAENNNSASITRPATLAAYADLQVENLSVTPSAPESGQPITIAWQDVNRGTNATETQFLRSHPGGEHHDQGRRCSTSGSSTAVRQSAWINPRRARSTCACPTARRSVGTLQITISSDNSHEVYEYVVGRDAEANNDASITRASTLASYADLRVQNLRRHAGYAGLGQLIHIAWQDAEPGHPSDGE